MPWTNGASSKTTLFKTESHKLFQEFEVGGTVHKGQPVTLDPTTGKVLAATAADLSKNIIGFSIHEGDSIYGDFVTVAMKSYAIINCTAKADVTAGPVEYAGYDTSEAYPGNQKEFAGYNQVQPLSVVVADTNNSTNAYPSVYGWALTPADAGEVVQVAVL